jgi:alkanesulfonate monooxygenase SsuD/methylene tetrahydromethanopterin reductase-like flavin-dependent oxidoreductase (luciferase family)
MGFRNPALLAKSAAAIDDISGGRLILGVGSGWHRGEYAAFGYPFDHRVGRFEEGLRILRDLLREGRSTLEGRYSQTRDLELSPPEPHAGRPPILVAAARPRMMRLTAELADAWNVAWYGAPDGFLADRARFHEACAAVGRDPATVQETVGVGIRYPGEAGPPPKPEEELSGPPEAIAEGLARYAELGVAHAVCVQPPDRRRLEFLAEALTIHRAAT